MEKIDFVNATHPAINDTNLNKMQDNIETAINAQVSGDTLPLGAMIPFPGKTIPENYLLCDGSAVSRTTYSLLFNVIGTTYGTGDGSTTFNLPDMRLRTAVGVDTRDSDLNAIGKTYGEKNHTMTVNELVEHYHPQSLAGGGGGNVDKAAYSWSVPENQYNYTGDDLATRTGGSQPFNIMQPSIAANYIIKAFQTAGVVAQVVNEHSTSTTDVYSASYINPQAIFCKLSADTTITNTYTDVNNWVKQTGVGNKLTISDGKIRIGAGINHVKVSVKIWGEVNSSSLIYTYIRKNNSNVDGTWQIHYVVQGQPQCIYNQCIVDVQEGDIITISLYGNGEVHSDTSIIVDKLD